MLELIEAINWAAIAPLLVIQGILMIIALLDWGKNEETNGPRMMWLFIIIFVNTLGPVLYFIFGRSKNR